MKVFSVPVILLLTTLLLAQCSTDKQTPPDPAPKPPPEYYGLASDTSGFVPFADSLMEAIDRNDTSFVFRHTSDEVRNGFGYNRGKEAFSRIWQDSALAIGNEIADALRLGVARSDLGGETSGYIYAPSHYITFPDSLDPFRHAWVLPDSIPVHREPAASSPVDLWYTQSLIRVNEWYILPEGSESADDAEIWARVSLPGQGEGYVKDVALLSPLDFRCWFEKVNGTWIMLGWAQGD